ncbi:MAG: response regulator [Chloroflexota bacterium]
MVNGYQILCVEDSVNVQQMLAFILKKAGYTPHIANNGREAIAMTDDLKPDLILMDIMMPDLAGIRAIELIKAKVENKDIPILVLSAYNDPKLIQQALDAGAVKYLEKTIVPEELVRMIETYLPQESVKE